MILVDTSATGSPVDQRLAELIQSEGTVAVSEPIVMEVLPGARSDEQEWDLYRLLLRFHLLRFDVAADLDGAMRINRRCRRAGVTPRGMVDRMIAAVAWRHRARLLAHDADMDRVAQVVGIDLDQGTLRG